MQANFKMNNQKIVWVLTQNKHLGLIPQAALVNYVNNQLELKFSIITSKNKHNYSHLIDEQCNVLLKYCMQLENDCIIAKVNDKNAMKWDAFSRKYFIENSNDIKITQIKNYIKDYVQKYLNNFFEKVGENLLFLNNGDIPSLWKHIYIDESTPEVFYHFNYSSEGIKYHLQILNENKDFKIDNAVLLTQNPARILLNKNIYQFRKEINGNNLVPFFSKKEIDIPENKSDVYLKIFVEPLIMKTRKIFTTGFKIIDIENTPKVIFDISPIAKLKQLSMFDETIKEDEFYKVQFSLYFEYFNYRFQHGQNTKNVFQKKENNEICYYRIERDLLFESNIVDYLKKIGIDFKFNSQIKPFEEGMEWINTNYQEIENFGIEINKNQKTNSTKRYFIGQSSISASASETIDWFEIKGIANFGEYSYSIKDIIHLIKQKKYEFRLPNGEYAIFPNSWIEEYSILGDYCIFKEDKIITSKYHFVILNELSKNGSLKLTLNKKLRALLESSPIKNFKLPDGFVGTLRNYQKEGYNWLLFLKELKLGGCLADDMGLGKTIQTLCLLQYEKEQNSSMSLLVVPKSLLYNWEHEAKTFCPNLKIYTHAGINRIDNLNSIPDCDILLTTYSTLRTDIELFENIIFNYCILDESQYIKNPQSGIAKACMLIKSTHFLTLTGTPIENSITDLWTQMHFVNRNILGSVTHFQKKYNTDEKIQILKKIIHPFILRRLKTKVAKDLPEKFVSVNYCEMIPEQLEFYRQIKNQFRQDILSIDKDNSKMKFNLLEGLLRMRQLANHPKLYDNTYSESSGKFNMVCEMLNSILSAGNKILIFSSFTGHLKLYKEYLENQNVLFSYLDGKTKDRDHQVTQFQTNENYKVFLLSLKAGGLGLNLTQAEYVFLLDPWWNPASEAQAYDRAHRIGQKNNVFVYKFISQNSIEEKIIELQNKKINLSESLIKSEDGFVKSLNREDIEYLLS